MTAPAQVVQLTCPNCGSPLRAQIITFVDATQQPQLKSYLLSGQMNAAPCATCGNVAMIAAPLIYHDAEKQLFLVFFPQQVNARPEEQERFIGEATSFLMRSLPADLPKGYILSPKRFLTLNSLIEAVLEADGITKEMIERQRNQIDLISQLAESYDQNPEGFDALVESRKADIDDAIFTMLDAFVASARQSGREESIVMLTGLRDRLAELVGYEGPAGEEGAEDDVDMAAVVDRMVAVEDEELEQAIVELRPAIDYEFFELLTERIDAAAQVGEVDEAARLTVRRDTILATAERMDREARELFDAGAQLLREAMASPDSEATLRENASKINDAFLLVLEANQAAAARAGEAAIADQLGSIHRQAMTILEESLPPEERFINQLLNAETPQDATKLLRSNLAMINTPLVRRMNEMADELEKGGQPEISARLRQLAREAGAMLF